jgi:hypothetical protein
MNKVVPSARSGKRKPRPGPAIPHRVVDRDKWEAAVGHATRELRTGENAAKVSLPALKWLAGQLPSDAELVARMQLREGLADLVDEIDRARSAP